MALYIIGLEDGKCMTLCGRAVKWMLHQDSRSIDGLAISNCLLID